MLLQPLCSIRPITVLPLSPSQRSFRDGEQLTKMITTVTGVGRWCAAGEHLNSPLILEEQSRRYKSCCKRGDSNGR